MDERTAFIRAICAQPDDDTARLVFADWLEERGEGERAEFIRVQCELARVYDDGREENGQQFLDRLYRLRERERELVCPGKRFRPHQEWFPQFGAEWAFKFDTYTGDVRHPAAFVSRGFVGRIELPAEAFLAIADKLVWRPEMTDECPECDGRGYTRERIVHVENVPCPKCKNGRIPRPCPATAQPITQVKLTTWPNIEVEGIESEDWAMMNRDIARMVLAEELQRRFGKGITFELP